MEKQTQGLKILQDSYERQSTLWNTFLTVQILLMWSLFLGKVLLQIENTLISRMMFKVDFLFFVFDILGYFWIYQSFRYYRSCLLESQDNVEEATIITKEFEFYCKKLFYVIKIFIGFQLLEKFCFFFLWNNETVLEFFLTLIVGFAGYFLLDWKFCSLYIEQLLIRNQ